MRESKLHGWHASHGSRPLDEAVLSKCKDVDVVPADLELLGARKACTCATSSCSSCDVGIHLYAPMWVLARGVQAT